MHVRRTEVLAMASVVIATAALVFALGSGFSLSAQSGTGDSDPPAEQPLSAEAMNVVPTTFNYQGTLRLADGSLANGSYKITLSIYNQAAGGPFLHQEIFDNTTVRDGIFNVVLGDNPNNPIGGDLFTTAPRYLGVQVGSDPEMSPRQRLHPVPWALLANEAGHAVEADHATSATSANTATSANVASTLIANARIGNVSLEGLLNVFGSDLKTYAARYLGRPDGNYDINYYEHSVQRVIIEAPDGGNAPNSVVIDDQRLISLCGDFDGCEITVAMRNWDTNANGQGALATIGPLRFSIAAPSQNNWRYWDRRTYNGERTFGWDGNGQVNHVVNAYDSCFFTDAVYRNGSPSDQGHGFTLLNWSGGYTASNMVCILIIDD